MVVLVPREWTLNLRDKMISEGGIVPFKGHAPNASEIVEVIEKSAFDKVVKLCRQAQDACFKLQAELTARS